MAARTYLPTLRRILHRASTYVASYDTRLEDAMTTGQKTAYTAFKSALADLVAALGPEPVQFNDADL